MISPIYIGGNDIISTARAYVAAGLSVIPVRTDGSKAPRYPNWREFSDRRPTDAELHCWFSSGAAGIGIPCGLASGNLVVLDFETWDAASRWGKSLTGDNRAQLADCPVVRTPSGGVHIYCRLTESEKGTKYAKDAPGKCLIETRGNGHFVVAPGSPPSCHPTGKPYEVSDGARELFTHLREQFGGANFTTTQALHSGSVKQRTRQALEEHQWNVSAVARALNWNEKTIRNKMAEFGIERPPKASDESVS